MRNLEVIETELAAAREALSNVKGTPAEVYSRIVGYYRSVRNWNRGKREEYGQRVMFQPDASLLASCTAGTFGAADVPNVPGESWADKNGADRQEAVAGTDGKLLLFVRPACPACPSAKAAAGKLGIPLELYDADTEEGLAEAVRHQVLSTPTAILLSSSGTELGRARDARAIEQLLEVNEAVAV
jgi:ribonucleoside-triphosphate reductase